ncbi:MAG: AAA family ATPase [Deltaproteobacteria bacterium]|nr:AAA family ATPase [Deltaproteobacteria bacterium]
MAKTSRAKPQPPQAPQSAPSSRYLAAVQRKKSLLAAVPPPSLPAEKCTVQFDLDALPFETTADLEPLASVIEQERAMQSLELGLSVTRPNYHVYVAGPSGTGKRSLLRVMLDKLAPSRKTPNDWVYVHNFDDDDAPVAIPLKAGDARELKKAVDKLLERLQKEVPAAFHSPEHQLRLQHAVSQSQTLQTDAFVALSRKAEQVGFVVRASKDGELETLPVVNGKSLKDKDVMALPEDERKAIDQRREKLEPLFTEFVQTNRKIEQTTQEKIEKSQLELAERVCKPLFAELRDRFKSGGKKLAAYLDDLYDHVSHHLSHLLPDNSDGDSNDDRAEPHKDPFLPFAVNVFVDNGRSQAAAPPARHDGRRADTDKVETAEKTDKAEGEGEPRTKDGKPKLGGAPVVFETHPTYYRLFGRIERRVEQGIYFTDHTMVRNGSLARANGGFLVCHAVDLVQSPGVWENLKVTLRNGELSIEDLGETAGLLPTSGLKPEPIALNVKIILIGSNSLYHLLYRNDDDFRKIFRVKADFDHEIRKSPEAVEKYVRFVATAVKNNGCRPVDKSAVHAILEHGARIVDSQRKLTLRFNRISILLIEADWFAGKARSKVITRKHVDKAIDQRTQSSSLIADKMHEDLLDDQWLIEAEGGAVGVINGLAVLSVGEHEFGRPFRITARAFTGTAGIVNIEREVSMSGEIHDKGVQILSGFLGDRFARKQPLCLTATVTFEQSYGEVDGDSASSTWLYAILSAIAEVPIDQGIGVTGSVNQLGQIQPIGGVNEKIEGFYRFCKAKGLNGRQGVLIPWQNVQHLVLSREVRDAIAKGKFHVWPISTVEQGLEILTGVQAGKMQPDGTYPAGTLMARVAERLAELRKSVAAAGKAIGRRTGKAGGGVRARRRQGEEFDGDEAEAGDDEGEGIDEVIDDLLSRHDRDPR